MEPNAETLARLLSLTLLTAATVEYIEILKRRVQWRAIMAQRAESEDVGLRGLVRVFLSESEDLARPSSPAAH